MNTCEPIWKLYISSEEIESVWKSDEPKVLKELKDTFGIDKPFEGYARIYWEKQITDVWHGGWDLRYAYERTGRPCSPNVDMWGIRESSKIHLEDCLSKSYPFCDLKSRQFVDIPPLMCINCWKEIIACESENYCARCYREHLNTWKPI